VDKLHQQRHRQKKYDKEISLGEQSLEGTKQNLKVCTVGIQGDLKNINYFFSAVRGPFRRCTHKAPERKHCRIIMP
jgi:hypothetical protein